MGGSLTIVGTGIVGVGDFTLRTIEQIRKADVVYYHVFIREVADFVKSLNSRAKDLSVYYGEDKNRRLTYVQMSESMLSSVRGGLNVVGIFNGHPGIFVMASRRAINVAKIEGFRATLLPAVSSIDCLIADLGVDPGLYGFQIVKAGSFVRGRARLATTSQVVLLQVSSVGDANYSKSGFKHARKNELISKLIELYGPNHEAVYYSSRSDEGAASVVLVRQLLQFLDISLLSQLKHGIIYLPPFGKTYFDVSSWNDTQFSQVEILL